MWSLQSRRLLAQEWTLARISKFACNGSFTDVYMYVDDPIQEKKQRSYASSTGSALFFTCCSKPTSANIFCTLFLWTTCLIQIPMDWFDWPFKNRRLSVAHVVCAVATVEIELGNQKRRAFIAKVVWRVYQIWSTSAMITVVNDNVKAICVWDSMEFFLKKSTHDHKRVFLNTTYLTVQSALLFFMCTLLFFIWILFFICALLFFKCIDVHWCVTAYLAASKC